MLGGCCGYRKEELKELACTHVDRHKNYRWCSMTCYRAGVCNGYESADGRI